jgi:hypothetical protein
MSCVLNVRSCSCCSCRCSPFVLVLFCCPLLFDLASCPCSVLHVVFTLDSSSLLSCRRLVFVVARLSPSSSSSLVLLRCCSMLIVLRRRRSSCPVLLVLARESPSCSPSPSIALSSVPSLALAVRRLVGRDVDGVSNSGSRLYMVQPKSSTPFKTPPPYEPCATMSYESDPFYLRYSNHLSITHTINSPYSIDTSAYSSLFTLAS